MQGKLWERESSHEHADHAVVFLDILRSYGHNFQKLSWSHLWPFSNGIYVNGIALPSNPEDDHEKNEVNKLEIPGKRATKSKKEVIVAS